MKGYISIEIPTKRYIRAYLIKELGEQPVISTDHRIGNKLYDLLNHNTNERRTEFSNQRYNARMKLYVNYHIFFQRGATLNETNIKNFNLFVEDEIKSRYRMYMDFYISMFPSFERNLPQVRKHIGIDLEDWPCDSIKKDYYRYRLKTGKDLLYNSNEERVILSPSSYDPAF